LSFFFFKEDVFVDLDGIYMSPEGKLVSLVVEKLPVHAVVGFPNIYFETGLGSTGRKMKVPNQYY
jgi:hypothetical protein